MKRNIQDWCKAFNRGEFNGNDFETQCDAGWFDWFCKETSLAGKTKKLGTFLNKIRDSKKLDFKHHISFKNNCPCEGPLYDDIRFADDEVDCNAFVISFNDKRSDHAVKVVDVRLYALEGATKTYEEAHVFEGTVKEAVNWFNK